MSQGQKRSLVSFLIHITASKPFISPKAFKAHGSFEVMPSCSATHSLLLCSPIYMALLFFLRHCHLTTLISFTPILCIIPWTSAATDMSHQNLWSPVLWFHFHALLFHLSHPLLVLQLRPQFVSKCITIKTSIWNMPPWSLSSSGLLTWERPCC